MKYLFMFGFLSFLFPSKTIDAQIKSIYDFKVASIDGGEIRFSDFKGKKILIVNTASKCGYTPQYAGLEQLYKEQKGNLIIVGFPANNFLFQEPHSNETIQSFCTKNYGVSFPMAAKIDVKGKKIHPLYVWLTEKKYNGFSDNSVKWNFQKYLIDEKGQLIEVFAPGVEPMSEEILSKLK